MSHFPFTNLISTEAELRKVIGFPSERAVRKQIPVLDEHCQAFIGRSPFLLIGSANACGECDVSPRGDVAGFVLVLNEKMLVIPDRPGNRRVDTLCNILENPHVGLLFMIPRIRETLRVNGNACILQDDDLLKRLSVQRKKPLLAIGVEVKEVFLHCAKAALRSHLWEPARWADPSGLASAGQILFTHTKPVSQTAQDIDRLLQHEHKTELY